MLSRRQLRLVKLMWALYSLSLLAAGAQMWMFSILCWTLGTIAAVQA